MQGKIVFFPALFCPLGQNEIDIKKCDAQIQYEIGNLRSPNRVRGNNRLKAVIDDTLNTLFFTKKETLSEARGSNRVSRIIFLIHLY